MFKQISEHARIIEKEIKECQSKLSKSPPGKLICTKNGKYTKWYVRNKGELTYIPKKNKDYASALAEKRYLQEKLSNLKSEQYACKLYLKHHRDIELDTLRFLDDHSVFDNLLSSKYLPLNEASQLWQHAEFKTNQQHPEALVHRSVSGHYLRSKSEVFIDMALFRNEIAFRYECELIINGISLYPDFTLINPVTGQLMYWEHFGLIDNPAYFKTFISKLQLYASIGIYPGINLIMTFETSDCPITYAEIEDIVKGLLR